MSESLFSFEIFYTNKNRLCLPSSHFVLFISDRSKPQDWQYFYNVIDSSICNRYAILRGNRKGLVIKTYCELADAALGRYKTEMINNDETIEEPFFSFDNDMLDGIKTKNEGIYCMNQRSVINFEITFPLFQDDEKAMKVIDLWMSNKGRFLTMFCHGQNKKWNIYVQLNQGNEAI